MDEICWRKFNNTKWIITKKCIFGFLSKENRIEFDRSTKKNKSEFNVQSWTHQSDSPLANIFWKKLGLYVTFDSIFKMKQTCHNLPRNADTILKIDYSKEEHDILFRDENYTKCETSLKKIAIIIVCAVFGLNFYAGVDFFHLLSKWISICTEFCENYRWNFNCWVSFNAILTW